MQTEKFYLDSETYVEGDDFVDSETLTADLEDALAESRRRKQIRLSVDREPLLFFSKDDFNDGDEYPAIDIDALNAQVDALIYNKTSAMRTTILTDDGRRIGPMMMTPQQVWAHHAALDAETQNV